MSGSTLTGAGGAGLALFAALSCARFGYEPLPEGVFAPLPNTTSPRHAGGFAGGGGADAGGGASGSGGTGSILDAGNAEESGADAAVSTAGTGGEALAGCGPAVPTAAWSFASDSAGW